MTLSSQQRRHKVEANDRAASYLAYAVALLAGILAGATYVHSGVHAGLTPVMVGEGLIFSAYMISSRASALMDMLGRSVTMGAGLGLGWFLAAVVLFAR